MRLRNKPGAMDKVLKYPEYILTDGTQLRGNWQKKFQKEQPIHIEVGSGKGQFIVEMAKAHPNINYIGIELQTNAIIAILEKQLALDLPNLQLLLVNGADLVDYFADGEIDRIYLNFSDPWPKTRHEKRRLTYSSFLSVYESIVKKGAEIHFKTDNQGLFEYSLVSLTNYGMTLKNVSLDLHNSDFEGNIMTEYEEKFANKGNRIYRLEAKYN